MKMKENLYKQSYEPVLATQFRQLSKQMLEHYQEHGESSDCIDVIQQEIHNFFLNTVDGQQLIEQLVNPVQHRAIQTNQHLIYRIIKTDKIKVTLHITSSGVEFPIHSHPGDLNALYVVEGAINLKQHSFERAKHKVKKSTLHSNSCNVGLQYYFNTHELKTKNPLTAFFSIRCKTPDMLFN